MDRASEMGTRWADPPCPRCGGWEAHAPECGARTRLKPSPACDVVQHPWCAGHRRPLSECYADAALRPGGESAPER